jgi:hypothetical protein
MTYYHQAHEGIMSYFTHAIDITVVLTLYNSENLKLFLTVRVREHIAQERVVCCNSHKFQNEISTVLDSWVTNTRSVNIFYPQKIFSPLFS